MNWSKFCPLLGAPADPLPFGPGLNCHRLVAGVAVNMAAALWEKYAAENGFYRRMRANGQVTEKAARRLFLARVGPRMLEDARLALADMLTQPDTLVPQARKDEIAEALILDNDLRAKRIVAEERLRAYTGMMH
jgi:hypothetical protein